MMIGVIKFKSVQFANSNRIKSKFTCKALVKRKLLLLSVDNSISHFFAFAELEEEENIWIDKFSLLLHL